MNVTLTMPFHPDSAVDLLNVMARSAARALRESPLPLLSLSGVVYQAEPIGTEMWLDPHSTFELGAGDCEDLAVWRAAELLTLDGRALLQGDPGYGRRVHEASVFLRQTGPTMFHAMVRYITDDGATHIADPSAELGMGPLPPLTRHRWAVAGVSPRRPRPS